LAVRCWLFAVGCSLLAVACWLFTFHFSLLAFSFSLSSFPQYYGLLIFLAIVFCRFYQPWMGGLAGVGNSIETPS